MRPLVAMFSLLLLSSTVWAQNEAVQAVTLQNAALLACCCEVTAPPKFSVKPGQYSASITVKITDKTRGAVVYYTTDGWTPTINSPRYSGPIVIDSTATLQAIAISPSGARSLVASAQYLVSGTPTSSSRARAAAPSKGTPVHLDFAEEVNSSTVSVGDKIPLILSEELQVGNVVVKKGASATATVTVANRTGAGGAPGVVSFQVDSLESDTGPPIALRGGATKEGTAKRPSGSFWIPVVGPVIHLAKHGTDAVIAKGTPFTAFLASLAPPEPPK